MRLKYTRRGKVLLGCRRHRGSAEHRGLGHRDRDSRRAVQAIFEEYYQLDNAARERSRGLGLGLSIVHRLGVLLGHQVHVRSWPGKGSVFSIEVALPPGQLGGERMENVGSARETEGMKVPTAPARSWSIEDDPDVRELLDAFLRDEGHDVVTAPDGVGGAGTGDAEAWRALTLSSQTTICRTAWTGCGGHRMLREELHQAIPAIILTGDISTSTLNKIAHQDCLQLRKPIKLKELTLAVQRLLPLPRDAVQARAPRPAEIPRWFGPGRNLRR